MPGLLQRLLTRSGILPVLRTQWRADQAAASDKLEKRLEKHLSQLRSDIARLSTELAKLMPQPESLTQPSS